MQYVYSPFNVRRLESNSENLVLNGAHVEAEGANLDVGKLIIG